jgi:hypothetical protein
MSDDLVKQLREDQPVTQDMGSTMQCSLQDAAADRIEELEAENKKLHKALELYERERTRFKHAKPEMTGEFFIAGCHGSKDNNLMPQFIEVCPAYGAGWVMIYENTGRTISYEGS